MSALGHKQNFVRISAYRQKRTFIAIVSLIQPVQKILQVTSYNQAPFQGSFSRSAWSKKSQLGQCVAGAAIILPDLVPEPRPQSRHPLEPLFICERLGPGP
jgi:hypothetical protein